ncbi:MAG: glycosyltransferase, partial [Bifidobacteriaceae bacterium]|nr:glycosyltransferase [Bifidobacteriaceae bacterium]
IGPLAREDGAELARRLAQDPDLAGRVRLRGRVPPERAWASARGAWAGLALLDQTPAFGRSMPSKVYEYLACGLPVITTPLPRPAALIRQTGAGAVVEDAVGAARVLRAWQSDPAAYRQVRQAAAAARAQALAQPDEMAAFARRVQSLAGQTG